MTIHFIHIQTYPTMKDLVLDSMTAALTAGDSFMIWFGRVMLATMGAVIMGAITYAMKIGLDNFRDWVRRINELISNFEKSQSYFDHHKKQISAELAVIRQIQDARHASIKGKLAKHYAFFERITESEKKISTLFALHNEIHNPGKGKFCKYEGDQDPIAPAK